MAKYKGKSVRLNKPSRITKGQPGYGRKMFKVFVKSLMFVICVVFFSFFITLFSLFCLFFKKHIAETIPNINTYKYYNQYKNNKYI